MYSFNKAERLCSKTLFEELVGSEYSFIKYPYRIVFKKSSVRGEFPARMAISVSKRKIKSAVKRNYVKRVSREAYRQNKVSLYEEIPDGETIDILFIYLDNNQPVYRKAEKAIKEALKKIAQILRTEPAN